MNFKPTIWKVILSLVIGITVSVIVFNLLPCDLSDAVGGPSDRLVVCPDNNFLGMSLWGIMGAIVIYLIWFLIQKKNIDK